MAGRKKKATIKLPELAGLRKLLGIEKAKRTKRVKATHKRATKLRNDPEFMGTYAGRVAVARGVRRESLRGMRGEPKGARNYYAHKDYRRALANPKLYMESYGLDAAGRRRRRRRK
jgi:hypothetical protein